MKNLEGFHDEEELQQLLFDGEINHLSYVFHHSEEKKMAFLDYCNKNGLQEDDAAAQQFLKAELQEEEDNHTSMD